LAGILFIISAPSGSGKSTLVNELRPRETDLEFSVSYTTRAPRGAEKDGSEYHFTTREHFQQMIENGEFLEWADVFGNYYGTACHSLDDAQARGKDLLLDIDVQGAIQVLKAKPDAVSIFVMPPDPPTLEGRLRNRSKIEGSLSEEIIQRRLARARQEIETYPRYRYILINDVLDRAVDELAAIVTAERAQRDPGYAYTSSDAGTQQAIAVAEQCLEINAGARLKPVLSSFGLEAAKTIKEAAHV
jgi:guanylate kinase